MKYLQKILRDFQENPLSFISVFFVLIAVGYQLFQSKSFLFNNEILIHSQRRMIDDLEDANSTLEWELEQRSSQIEEMHYTISYLEEELSDCENKETYFYYWE